ncbi:MAG: hypothetical protein DRO06_02780 [Thermoproteota archaeon]|nr:MAG: hypothetical protein DRO06_02780 [Candidatus Korarchaeota archaeon]
MDRRKAIVVGLVALGVGVLSLASAASGGYVDVSRLRGMTSKTRVVVTGRVVDTLMNASTDTLAFVMEGEDGFRIVAVYSLSRFIQEYGAPPSHTTVKEQVVMSGVYDPATRTLSIEKILQGCHSAYEAPPAEVGG